jgi:hypothetical protein
LEGWDTCPVLTRRAEYHRKRLFKEKPGAARRLPLREPKDALLTGIAGGTERKVGVRQPLQEARELVESTYSLRADVLRYLLKRCTSVKTVRPVPAARPRTTAAGAPMR